MPRPITGKTHVGERHENRPNGDIYIYERITAYDEKTRKTYTVSQKLRGKVKSGTLEIVPTRPKKHKGEGCIADATRQHTGLTDILDGRYYFNKAQFPFITGMIHKYRPACCCLHRYGSEKVKCSLLLL